MTNWFSTINIDNEILFIVLDIYHYSMASAQYSIILTYLYYTYYSIYFNNATCQALLK